MISSVLTCSTCQAGYYLNSNSCTVIPSANTNCSNGTSNSSGFTCTACSSGYYLSSTGTCISTVTPFLNCANGSVTNTIFSCS